MKKLLTILLSLALLVFFTSSATAQTAKPDAQKGNTSRQNTSVIKATLKKFVATEKNGDVVIKQNPDSKVNNSEALLRLIGQVDATLDQDVFNKTLEKEGGRTGYVNDMMNAADIYLSKVGMRVKSTKFSAGSARTKIDEGLPFFVMLKRTGEYNSKLVPRTSKRPTEGKMDDWKKALSKETVRNWHFENLKIVYALLRGYNKTTGEFAVEINGGQLIWFAESELKSAVDGIYEIRF